MVTQIDIIKEDDNLGIRISTMYLVHAPFMLFQWEPESGNEKHDDHFHNTRTSDIVNS